jgi:hypothetical protein
VSACQEWSGLILMLSVVQTCTVSDGGHETQLSTTKQVESAVAVLAGIDERSFSNHSSVLA